MESSLLNLSNDEIRIQIALGAFSKEQLFELRKILLDFRPTHDSICEDVEYAYVIMMLKQVGEKY
jgi:hypothetical protein